MGAPLIREDWKGRLSSLSPDWDGYGSVPVTEAALATVGEIAVVPCSGGGVQLEMHRDGFDIEIQIDRDGRLRGGLLATA
jgi:hypothetical protein